MLLIVCLLLEVDLVCQVLTFALIIILLAFLLVRHIYSGLELLAQLIKDVNLWFPYLHGRNTLILIVFGLRRVLDDVTGARISVEN